MTNTNRHKKISRAGLGINVLDILSLTPLKFFKSRGLTNFSESLKTKASRNRIKQAQYKHPIHYVTST